MTARNSTDGTSLHSWRWKSDGRPNSGRRSWSGRPRTTPPERKQERLAAIAAIRRKIFEIADRAGDDAHTIRSMTRPLDCRERDVECSNYYPWNDDDQG